MNVRNHTLISYMDVLLLRDEIRDYASIYKGREHRECGLSLYVDTVLETELKTADDFQQTNHSQKSFISI